MSVALMQLEILLLLKIDTRKFFQGYDQHGSHVDSALFAPCRHFTSAVRNPLSYRHFVGLFPGQNEKKLRKY